MNTIRRLVAIVTTFAISVAALAAPLQDHVSVPVPSGVSAPQVEAAITIAMEGRKWVATDHKPGEIDAVLAVRTHIANVRIAYDTKAVTINYVSSVNLDYSEHDGQREIHHNYNGWVLRLARDINTTLQKAVLTQQNPQ